MIVIESVVCGLCWTGATRMARAARGSGPDFAAAKSVSVVGLTMGYLLWQVGLFAIGNEWFGMWMSREWTGTDSAFRFVVMTLGALIYVASADGAVSASSSAQVPAKSILRRAFSKNWKRSRD